MIPLLYASQLFDYILNYSYLIPFAVSSLSLTKTAYDVHVNLLYSQVKYNAPKPSLLEYISTLMLAGFGGSLVTSLFIYQQPYWIVCPFTIPYAYFIFTLVSRIPTQYLYLIGTGPVRVITSLCAFIIDAGCLVSGGADRIVLSTSSTTSFTSSFPSSLPIWLMVLASITSVCGGTWLVSWLNLFRLPMVALNGVHTPHLNDAQTTSTITHDAPPLSSPATASGKRIADVKASVPFPSSSSVSISGSSSSVFSASSPSVSSSVPPLHWYGLRIPSSWSLRTTIFLAAVYTLLHVATVDVDVYMHLHATQTDTRAHIPASFNASSQSSPCFGSSSSHLLFSPRFLVPQHHMDAKTLLLYTPSIPTLQSALPSAPTSRSSSAFSPSSSVSSSALSSSSSTAAFSSTSLQWLWLPVTLPLQLLFATQHLLYTSYHDTRQYTHSSSAPSSFTSGTHPFTDGSAIYTENYDNNHETILNNEEIFQDDSTNSVVLTKNDIFVLNTLTAHLPPLFHPLIPVVHPLLTTSRTIINFGNRIIQGFLHHSIPDPAPISRLLTSLTAYALPPPFSTLSDHFMHRHTPHEQGVTDTNVLLHTGQSSPSQSSPSSSSSSSFALPLSSSFSTSSPLTAYSLLAFATQHWHHTCANRTSNINSTSAAASASVCVPQPLVLSYSSHHNPNMLNSIQRSISVDYRTTNTSLPETDYTYSYIPLGKNPLSAKLHETPGDGSSLGDHENVSSVTVKDLVQGINCVLLHNQDATPLPRKTKSGANEKPYYEKTRVFSQLSFTVLCEEVMAKPVPHPSVSNGEVNMEATDGRPSKGVMQTPPLNAVPLTSILLYPITLSVLRTVIFSIFFLCMALHAFEYQELHTNPLLSELLQILETKCQITHEVIAKGQGSAEKANADVSEQPSEVDSQPQVEDVAVAEPENNAHPETPSENQNVSRMIAPPHDERHSYISPELAREFDQMNLTPRKRDKNK